MRKIPTLFARDEETNRRYVRNEVTPGCEWVLAGEGTPTRKYDGTCVMFDGAAWWARREVKAGKEPPPNFIAIETDDVTGKTVGWEPMEQSSFHKWLLEALGNSHERRYVDTYELIGPKINGDLEGEGAHALVRHADAEDLPDAPRDFAGLAAWLGAHDYEGIVWHHPGRPHVQAQAPRLPEASMTSATRLVALQPAWLHACNSCATLPRQTRRDVRCVRFAAEAE